MGKDAQLDNAVKPTDSAAADTSAIDDAGDLSRTLWNAAEKPAHLPEKKNELDQSADICAQNMALATSEADIAAEFKQFLAENKDKSPFKIMDSLSKAFDKNDLDFRLGYVGTGNDGTMSLGRKDDKREETLLVQGQYLRAGEDIDTDFNPNKPAINQIAEAFASGNPGQLDADALKQRVDQVIEDMRVAGASPTVAGRALNKSLEAHSQPLEIDADPDGEFLLNRVHQPRPIATVELHNS
jgi:hypothetical protein